MGKSLPTKPLPRVLTLLIGIRERLTRPTGYTQTRVKHSFRYAMQPMCPVCHKINLQCQSSYQDPDGIHHNLRVATQSAAGLTVAVPSRLYFTPSKSKPLAGLRIAVKDLFDLRGMKTSGGNRALYEMGEPKSTTAVAVQKLMDAGAVIVGKNKLSEFAYAGGYHTDHIDYLLPFNPRGDGYNSPGDSSGGSGASVASYEWLDASLGSDTGGSIRGPASQNGVFGSRPSHGAVNMTGSLVLSNSMDTGGVLARDPKLWSRINKVLYSGFAKEYTNSPGRFASTQKTSGRHDHRCNRWERDPQN